MQEKGKTIGFLEAKISNWKHFVNNNINTSEVLCFKFQRTNRLVFTHVNHCCKQQVLAIYMKKTRNLSIHRWEFSNICVSKRVALSTLHKLNSKCITNLNCSQRSFIYFRMIPSF